MLDDFLTANRDEILTRARELVARRQAPLATDLELTEGLPLFLDQLGDSLRVAESTRDLHQASIVSAASRHGGVLLRKGFTVAQIVRDYGDLCQVITSLAVEQEATITTAEFRTLNLCLDDAIAGAVTEFNTKKEEAIRDEGNERLGVLAHEMRNQLNSAVLSFDMIQRGVVAPGGSTSQVHTRSLLGLRNLIDRSFADVRLDSGIQNLEHLSVNEIFEDVEIGAYAQAQTRDISFEITTVERSAVVEADRQILAAAVANLLQNAFKFTSRNGRVVLTARVTATRVLIEVEDQCGGLPPGMVEGLFRPFEQRGKDRTGLGLGLSICLKAVKAIRGELRVHDLPGKGCVFTIDLPKQAPPPTPIHTRRDERERATAPEGGQSRKREAS
jgi:signal transduction histidine kinase